MVEERDNLTDVLVDPPAGDDSSSSGDNPSPSDSPSPGAGDGQVIGPDGEPVDLGLSS